MFGRRSLLTLKMNRLPTKVTAFAVLLTIHLCSAQTARKQNADAADGAAKFVQSIYSRYGPNGDPPSLFEENAGMVFHSSLIALAREDQRAVGPGSAGVIDGDPVCNCQDTDVKFEHLKLQIEAASEESCKVAVNFADKSGVQTPIVLVLVKENEQWRIYDIENHGRGGRPSLRAALEKEIQRLSGTNNPNVGK
jgi:Protein of unknown function (DUF3828)